MTYKQFDVVVVPFPFTDTSATKRRPALVLSDEVFNAASGHSVMAMITTSTHAPWVLDVRISDLKSSGLTITSVVRMKLFTLDHILVLKQIGTLGQEDRKLVQNTVKRLFNHK